MATTSKPDEISGLREPILTNAAFLFPKPVHDFKIKQAQYSSSYVSSSEVFDLVTKYSPFGSAECEVGYQAALLHEGKLLVRGRGSMRTTKEALETLLRKVQEEVHERGAFRSRQEGTGGYLDDSYIVAE